MTTISRLFILPLLLTLAACADGSKYPFPPQFVDGSDVSPRVLAAPPALGSTTYDAEINAILKRQAALSDAEKEAIAAEDHISPAMIVTPVLGAHFTEGTHPELFVLLRHSASDAWQLSDATQDYWKRTRPWLADDRVEILVSRITRPSYPSGHTVTNHVWAHVLSDLFPKKRKALFDRAYAIGRHRMDAGVHFPSDVVAGKKFAAMVYEKMRKDAAFKRELAKARAEIARNKAAPATNALPRGEVPKPCMRTTNTNAMTVCL